MQEVKCVPEKSSEFSLARSHNCPTSDQRIRMAKSSYLIDANVVYMANLLGYDHYPMSK